MARYIDADKFAKRIEVSPAFTNMGYEGQFLKNIVLDLLNNVPTADVAPKSEVEQLRLENSILSQNADTAFQDGLNEAQDLYAEQIKTEVAREIFEEIECMLIRYTLEDRYGEYISTHSVDEFVELKKKYT